MKKIFNILTLILIFFNPALAGDAEDKYWDTYADRIVKNSHICEYEAEKNGEFNSNIFDQCNYAMNKIEKIRHESAVAKDKNECDSMRRKIENSKMNAGSNVGNFLLGMLNQSMQNMACY